MPIFISRFSPDRSLIGNFVSSRTRSDTDEPESAQGRTRSATTASETNRSTQPQDHLELSRNQQSSNNRPVRSDSSGPAAIAQSSSNTNAARSREQGADTSEAARLLSREPRRAAEGVQNSLQALASGLRSISRGLIGRSTVHETEPAAPEVTATTDQLRLDIGAENRLATAEATVSRLEAFLERLDDLTIPQMGEGSDNEVDAAALEEATALESAPGSEGNGESEVVQSEVLQTLQAPPPPAREIQEQQLQRNLRTIATGLQSDAAIESRLNVATASRTAERSVQQSQRRTARENQAEVRSLQVERRRLQQDIQQTDQAIRQIQGRNSRVQNASSQSAISSLDILAQ